jgi:transcriptional regulator of met regulon
MEATAPRTMPRHGVRVDAIRIVVVTVVSKQWAFMTNRVSRRWIGTIRRAVNVRLIPANAAEDAGLAR